jgi:hypothetical protein
MYGQLRGSFICGLSAAVLIALLPFPNPGNPHLQPARATIQQRTVPPATEYTPVSVTILSDHTQGAGKAKPGIKISITIKDDAGYPNEKPFAVDISYSAVFISGGSWHFADFDKFLVDKDQGKPAKPRKSHEVNKGGTDSFHLDIDNSLVSYDTLLVVQARSPKGHTEGLATIHPDGSVEPSGYFDYQFLMPLGDIHERGVGGDYTPVSMLPASVMVNAGASATFTVKLARNPAMYDDTARVTISADNPAMFTNLSDVFWFPNQTGTVIFRTAPTASGTTTVHAWCCGESVSAQLTITAKRK